MIIKSIIRFVLVLQFLFPVYANAKSVLHEKMGKLSTLVGDWSQEHYTYSEEGTWEKTGTSNLKLSKSLSDLMISGETRDMVPAEGMNLELSFTYDLYRKIYRMSVVDSIYGLMDIYEGEFNQDGHLMLTNINKDTFFPVENGAMHFRFTFKDDDPDKISCFIEQTSDAGEKWSPMLNYIMTRQ
ncbi:DUF1579 family protein [Pseudemcibacter aquimaris]|uniref:DUF1579 family protein n=1 Tax=Pseudemcibacter aquimaris TaxID=2857064 RepID=UPI0020114324|nr:DUF1579 family protein [Pseudemcibacter aquimaris]MCC3859582.1 DUF1579 domain-containing protein [Pseudemcibacter aquimaris]WDU59978.1 DUF1579 domain-containing protein [Pseudemcibacter aquimaris]